MRIVLHFVLALMLSIPQWVSAQSKTPPAPTQRECAAHDKHVQLMGMDAAYAKRHSDLEMQTAAFVQSRQEARENGAQLQPVVVTIPVVFHVVYANDAENIPDSKLLEQLQVLNDDFRRLNADQDNIWPQAADTEIEFCLATRDPNGAPTDGILRVPTTVGSFGTSDNVKFSSAGGSDAWPREDYMNFWVCNLGGGLLGYAQFPGGPAATDGIVCGYQFVGLNGPGAGAYNLGRTATHEVGHWLNLRHIWGDGGCGVDDFVADTPESDGANYGCALGSVSCGSEDMVQNYMDYSDDACMNVFSQGQADRMQALFAPGGSRVSLLSSNGCLPAVPDFDLDAAILNVAQPADFSCATDVTPEVTLFNNGAVDLTSATLTYSVDGGPDQTFSWTGSLAFGESEAILLPSLTPGDGDHTFDIAVSAPNGGTDENVGNDAGSSSFSLDSQGVDVVMTLTLDNYPGETTWELVDAAGTVVWNGGPYSGGGTVVETSCVGDGCYTLNVYDSFGDGMCCAFGNGGYEFSQGGVVLASGGDFASLESTEVCVGNIVLGCTDDGACNYNPDAVVDDGTCDFSCFGCTDPAFCNYNPTATVDDGSCADIDQCGVCAGDGTSCVGCTDSTACNYNPDATIDDASCTYPPVGGICDCFTDLSLTETLTGGQAGTAATFTGTGEVTGIDITLDYTTAPGSWPADMLVVITSPDGNCIEFGGFSATVTAGCTDLGNYSAIWPADWAVSASGIYTASVDLIGSGLTGSGDWSLQLINAYSASGAVTYIADITVNEVCIGGVVEGCTDPASCNYDANATIDDGSCADLDLCGICAGDNSTCVDCTDPEACNYNPSATIDDGSCTYPPADNLDCDGNCLNDNDGDGICDEDESAQSSFVQLGYDVVGQNTIAGMTTYRVWAEFSDPTEQLVVVYGFDSVPLTINTTTSFYQNGLGGPLASSINPAVLPVDPDLAYDSWLTIGGEDNNADINTIGLDFADFEGSGGSIVANDVNGGSVFIYPDLEPAAFPDADGHVLIAQLTTDGEVSLTVNLQTRLADGSNPQILQQSLTFQEVYECFGDFNNDGLIGIGDILLLLGDFGCPSNCTYDMNGDDGVTTSDMLVMLSIFGTSCE